MDRIAEILALLATPAELTDAQVGELEAELLAIFQDIRAGEYEGVEARDVTTLQDIATAVENLRALAAERYTEAATVDAALEALEAQLAADGGDGEGDDADAEGGEGDGDGAEGAAGTEGDDADAEGAPAGTQAVAAAAGAPAAATTTRVRTPLGAGRAFQPGRGRGQTPAPAPVDPGATLLASGLGGGELENLTAGAEHMADVFGRTPRGAGKVPVIEVVANYPEDRRLSLEDSRGNRTKIDAVIASAQDPAAWTEDVVTAAGWCTPSPVQYGQIVQAGAMRPVRDALPSFMADRGGARIPVSPTLSVIETDGDPGSAIGIWTEADDGDDEAEKPVQVIDCPEWVDFRAYAVTKRLQFKNMAARAYPENVRVWNDLAAAAHARVAETKLLDLIKGDAGTSELVQPTHVFGAAIDVVELVLRLTAFMRSAERTDPNARVRALLPAWIIQLLQSDQARSGRVTAGPPTALVVARDRIVQMLGDAGVTPTFYIDSPSTGTSQLLRKQTDGQAPALWPCDVQFGLWFEGHYGFLDGGSLDLGIWRDGTLIAKNAFENFAETFEGIFANRGPEALWVTQAVLADGTYQGPIDGDVECGS
jgi:hypothetical protein